MTGQKSTTRHQFLIILLIPLILFILFLTFNSIKNEQSFVSYIKYFNAINDNKNSIIKEEYKDYKDFSEWLKLRKEYYKNKYLSIDDKLFRNLIDPPPPEESALVARYVVNQSNWTSVATISTNKNISSYPFANVVALSDGPFGNGLGTPYMFLTPLDFTGKDTAVDPRVTLLVTLAEGSYCHEKLMEPIDPRCVRVILSGFIKKVEKDAPDYQTANQAIFTRHPGLTGMPKDHHFYLAKLDIGFIAVVDTFGGAKFVDPYDYYHPKKY